MKRQLFKELISTKGDLDLKGLTVKSYIIYFWNAKLKFLEQ